MNRLSNALSRNRFKSALTNSGLSVGRRQADDSACGDPKHTDVVRPSRGQVGYRLLVLINVVGRHLVRGGVTNDLVLDRPLGAEGRATVVLPRHLDAVRRQRRDNQTRRWQRV